MSHLCGYVTLLNTGRESRTIWKHEEDEDELKFNTNNSFASHSLSGSIHSSDSGSNLLDEPINGLKDKVSAAMLANEIDLLTLQEEGEGENPAPTNANKPTSLEIKEDTSECLVEDEWNILECYFGIPLFEPGINQEICDRIVSQKLFHSNRYVGCDLVLYLWTPCVIVCVLHVSTKHFHSSFFPVHNQMFNITSVLSISA